MIGRRGWWWCFFWWGSNCCRWSKCYSLLLLCGFLAQDQIEKRLRMRFCCYHVHVWNKKTSQRYHDALEGSPCFVCKIYGIGYTFNSHIPNHVFFRHSICCHVIFYFTAQSERQVVFDHLYNMLSTKVWLLFLLGKQSMLPFSHAVRLATVACITRKSLKQYPILNIMSSRTVS